MVEAFRAAPSIDGPDLPPSLRVAARPGHPIPPAVERIGTRVVGACLQVHRELGPGLLESAYQKCLAAVLEEGGMQVQTQVTLPLQFRGRRIAGSYRLDMLVEDAVLVEAKAVERMLPVHAAQLSTYLRLTGRSLGFLVNFNVPRIRDGIRRIIRTGGADLGPSSHRSIVSSPHREVTPLRPPSP